MYKENLIREAINKSCSLNLEKPIAKYLQFDAYDKNYIVEIKARRKYYETQIIELSKFALICISQNLLIVNLFMRFQ